MESSPRHSLRHLAIAAGAIALLAGGMWIANQGGLAPRGPDKFVGGTIYQALRSLPIVALLWFTAIGFGAPIRQWLAPDAKHWLVIQIASGLGVLLTIDWLAAWAGLLNPWSAWLICGLGAAVLSWHFSDPKKREQWHPDHWPNPPWTLLLGLPVVGLLIVACTCPPGTMWAVEAFGYDVTSYHLEVPREWLAAGRMQSLRHNVYSHLPMLVETGYMQIGAMHGSMLDGVYTTQFFHASTAVLAAIALAQGVGLFVGATAGALAGVMLLATPWTIITGSLAYDEMFVLAFGATALLVMFEKPGATRRGAVLVGMLVGWATLAKLTAGGMIALPVGVMLLWRVNEVGGENQAKAQAVRETGGFSGDIKEAKRAGMPTAGSVKLAAVAALAGVLTLAPWFIRNAAWTGNPVFPFAAGMFGKGHWSDELADRWGKAHMPGGVGAGVVKLGRQWLFNTGYGAVAGREVDERSVTDVARFDTEGGLPVLWLAAFVGAGFVLAWRGGRRVGAAMLIMLAVQLAFWILATHHQSRFLIFTLLPGCALAGLGMGRIEQHLRAQSAWMFPATAATLLLVMTVTSFSVFFSQTPSTIDSQTRTRVHFPPYLLVDSLINPQDPTLHQPGRFAGRHQLNSLPAGSKAYLVADAMGILYIRIPFFYHTAFDASPLGVLIRQFKQNPIAVTAALRQGGFTHVWVHWSELQRLGNSYGYDADVTPQFLLTIARLWKPAEGFTGDPRREPVTLYLLPTEIRVRPATGGETPGNVQPPNTSP